MRWISLLIAIYGLSAHAYVVSNKNGGSGIELLMGGVGQARVGSNGALTSNPSLLAWLPKKQEYISTNTIRSFRTRPEGTGTRVQVSTELIPLIAATTEGFGDWGHSYGFVSERTNFEYSGIAEGVGSISLDGTQNLETIAFAYGFGKKLSNDFSFGSGFRLGRTTQKNKMNMAGLIEGSDYIGFSSVESSFWDITINPGMTKIFGSWAWGFSGVFTAGKFNFQSTRKETTYFEDLGSLIREEGHDKERVTTVSQLRTGVLKTFETGKLFFDLVYVPSFTDTDVEEKSHIDPSFSGILGYEQRLNERYRGYTSAAFAPGTNDEPSFGQLTLGFSKKNLHSMNYMGLAWQRQVEKASEEVVQLFFGSKFHF